MIWRRFGWMESTNTVTLDFTLIFWKLFGPSIRRSEELEFNDVLIRWCNIKQQKKTDKIIESFFLQHVLHWFFIPVPADHPGIFGSFIIYILFVVQTIEFYGFLQFSIVFITIQIERTIIKKTVSHSTKIRKNHTNYGCSK